MQVARTVLLSMVMTLAALPAGAQTTGKNELSVFAGLSLLDVESRSPRVPYILEARPEIGGLIYPPTFNTYRSLDGSGEFGARYGRDVTETITLTGDFSLAPTHKLSEHTTYGCPEPLVCIAAAAESSIAIFPVPDFLFSEGVVAYHYGGGLRLNVLPGALRPAVIAGLGGVTYAGTNHRKTQFVLRVGGSVTASVKTLTTTIEVLDAIVADHYVTNKAAHDVHVRIAFGVRW